MEVFLFSNDHKIFQASNYANFSTSVQRVHVGGSSQRRGASQNVYHASFEVVIFLKLRLQKKNRRFFITSIDVGALCMAVSHRYVESVTIDGRYRWFFRIRWKPVKFASNLGAN